jgi:hypothetical protein
MMDQNMITEYSKFSSNQGGASPPLSFMETAGFQSLEGESPVTFHNSILSKPVRPKYQYELAP